MLKTVAFTLFVSGTILVGTIGVRAQSSDPVDLTEPRAFRPSTVKAEPAVELGNTKTKTKRDNRRRPQTASRTEAPVDTAAKPAAARGAIDRPVDFGLAMHGGGGGGHTVSASSESQAYRDSGNGVTAGVRFGF